MAVTRIPILNWLVVGYAPAESDRSFLERTQTQTQGDIEVSVAVLDAWKASGFSAFTWRGAGCSRFGCGSPIAAVRPIGSVC